MRGTQIASLKSVLVSWAGATDLKAAENDPTVGIGPIAQAAAFKLAKARFPAELIQSSMVHGVEIASVPFDIAAEFLPDVLHEADRRLGQLSAGQAPAKAEFNAILHRSAVIRRLLLRAEKVAVLKLPPLREREGDLSLLIDRLLEQVNRDSAKTPGYPQKKLAPGARNLLLAHPWPGNVRELLNTLQRAVLWSEGATITEEELREALLPFPAREDDHVLNRPLTPGFSLQDLLGEVIRHYL